MEDNEPQSQSLSSQVWERAQWARDLSASYKEGSPDPGGQQGRWSPQPSSAEPLAANAKGDRSVWHGSAPCCVELLPQLYCKKWYTPPFWVISINVLAFLMPSLEFAQEPMGGTWLLCLTPLLASVEFAQEPGWSHSADTADLTCGQVSWVCLLARHVCLTMWADMPPCQMCSLWLR